MAPSAFAFGAPRPGPGTPGGCSSDTSSRSGPFAARAGAAQQSGGVASPGPQAALAQQQQQQQRAYSPQPAYCSSVGSGAGLMQPPAGIQQPRQLTPKRLDSDASSQVSVPSSSGIGVQQGRRNSTGLAPPPGVQVQVAPSSPLPGSSSLSRQLSMPGLDPFQGAATAPGGGGMVRALTPPPNQQMRGGGAVSPLPSGGAGAAQQYQYRGGGAAPQQAAAAAVSSSSTGGVQYYAEKYTPPTAASLAPTLDGGRRGSGSVTPPAPGGAPGSGFTRPGAVVGGGGYGGRPVTPPGGGTRAAPGATAGARNPWQFGAPSPSQPHGAPLRSYQQQPVYR